MRLAGYSAAASAIGLIPPAQPCDTIVISMLELLWRKVVAAHSYALRRFLDNHERVKVWPARKTDQQLVLRYLASKFQPGVGYSEKEVNAILNRYHTFEDYALLRRSLYDYGFLERERNGSRYWLAAATADTTDDTALPSLTAPDDHTT
ncbi:MAG: hypothetical protein KatS3mg057_1238 [Herpetosiphonaceae bacterium]|nr:MAG: hypothetical protein KatS3mg057_1238 [Herpetosiphonaceae bacterium]